MDHQTDIALVHTHSESGSCDYDPDMSSHEIILVLYLLFRKHLAVICPCRETVLFQSFRQIFSFPRSRHIYDDRTCPSLDKSSERLIFCLFVSLRKDCIMQIRSGYRRREQLQSQS